MDQRTGIHIVRIAAFSVATLLGACSGEPTPEGASGVAPGAASSRTTSVTAVARVATPASTAPPKTGVPAGKGGEGGIVAFTKGVAHVTCATGGTAADEDLPLTVGAAALPGRRPISSFASPA
ncbi:MAG: hypothetical protein U0360_03280 [Dehalococcoidia bacterium]